ncbi:Cro/CI family transcriptional regulator [Scandinavium sp. H11S7]|uniref:Cro/CI family transcriptional regulator n=1 Tax=Scandinavium hiltneri TaxID=2926519 RepID=UPI002164FD54|nr:Cro/CI family transcriptional regulator [Scandinavium hiltneri]MCS2155499.1 Cro/CI family transcriptional regulator [Scandinavium hiltneri]
MKIIPLSEYVLANGQAKTAEALGVYQSAISKALKHKRKVNILVKENGKIEAEEVRPFPSKSRPDEPDALATP